MQMKCVTVILASIFINRATALDSSQQVLNKDVLGAQVQDLGSQGSLNEWIKRQEKVALEKLLDNITPGGKFARETIAGTVLASPSKQHPDYFYQWTRDSGITLGTLVDIYAKNTTSDFARRNVEPIMGAFLDISLRLQQTSNPSGSFDDLSGLGEPKFNADGTAFLGNWGRPQRDGPALRAITLMAYLRAYNASHPGLWHEDRRHRAYSNFYTASLPPNSAIKADLEYVARYWNDDGFDIWEEVNSKHFFTAMVQHRALSEGAEVAEAFGDLGAAKWYRDQRSAISQLLDEFWNDEKGHLVATLHGKRSGLDCSLALGAIHGLANSVVDHSHRILSPHSDEILVSLLYLIRDQRDRHAINRARHAAHGKDLTGAGIGRYPEDIYDGYENSDSGGNPWFICTATAAEILYRTALHLHEQESLTITSRGLPFWSALLPDHEIAANETHNASSSIYDRAISNLIENGNSFLSVIREHSAEDGSLSEQLDGETGFERGARDLTWSYGSFLQAVAVRKQLSVVDLVRCLDTMTRNDHQEL